MPPSSLRRPTSTHAEWTARPRRRYRMAMAISVPRYTVDDLERFPDDGNRYELLEGMLLVTPAPRAVHQVVAARIQSRLAAALDAGAGGAAHVVGPGAISLPPGTQLQPDILVYPSTFGPM